MTSQCIADSKTMPEIEISPQKILQQRYLTLSDLESQEQQPLSIQCIVEQNETLNDKCIAQQIIHSVSDLQQLHSFDLMQQCIADDIKQNNQTKLLETQFEECLFNLDEALQTDDDTYMFTVDFPYCNSTIVENVKIKLEQIKQNYRLEDFSISTYNIKFNAKINCFDQIYQDIWNIYREIFLMHRYQIQQYFLTRCLQIIIYQFRVLREELNLIFIKILRLIEDNGLEFNDIYLNEQQSNITIVVSTKEQEKYRRVLQEYESFCESYNFDEQQKPQSIFPQQWVPQQQNLLKVITIDVEYQKIYNLFHATRRKSKIYTIQRIQNKALWRRYTNERNKVLRFHQARSQDLKPEEIEIYAWNCIGNQGSYHPDRIGFNPQYNQLKQGVNFNTSVWGEACYYSLKADDIYSYPFTIYDDQNNALQCKKRKVLLCCLLTTGRVKECTSDFRKMKTPGDFDCVSGIVGGSTVYMLYGTGIRRAYPAYEVIYE